jgi:hypothetical protein
MPIRPIARAQRWSRGYQLELVGAVTPEFDRLFERVARSYVFLIRRDSKYLRWRYLENPEAGAFIVAIRRWRQLVGWSVFRVRGTNLVWGDALFDRTARGAIEVLIRHVAPGYPVERIEAWFPPRPQWFAEALQRLGFVQSGEPQDLSLMCVPFTLPDATQRMRDALYYTMGDSDLF